MKRITCKSGIKGWQCRLRKNYIDYEEFKQYDNIYGLIHRLGFSTSKKAWAKNPIIEGSINPDDFRLSA